MKQLSTLAVLLLYCLVSQVGCARLYAGLDGELNYNITDDDLRDVEYGYLSVGSVPEGAEVYYRVTVTHSVNFRVGLFFNDDGKKSVTSEWATLGTTPVLNHEIARSGRAVDWKIGSRARYRFRTHSVTVRVEKAGYETRTFEHVALSNTHVATPRLVVELVPVQEDEAAP